MDLLTNPVRRYDWGTTTVIPDLLGVRPDGQPQAELWLGGHKDSPSKLADGTRLDHAVSAAPGVLLGAHLRARFGDRLPYLVKVLSAASPLSMQVHPDARQAADGFAKEEARSVPADAPHRRYRDPHHKPEMLLALGRFEALCGLRDPAQSLELLDGLKVDHEAWPMLLDHLAAPGESAALRGAITWLLDDDTPIGSLVPAVVDACRAHPDIPEMVTAVDLARAYPGDRGLVVALLLNRVTLTRGQAIFLPAGNIHSYLGGTGVEVMASSDNVLRAGLTSKHVDVPELLRTVEFTARPVPRVLPQGKGPVVHYRPEVAEFELAWAELSTDGGWQHVDLAGPQIILVLEGDVRATTDNGAALSLARGQSAFVAAADAPLALRGDGIAVVVGVPR